MSVPIAETLSGKTIVANVPGGPLKYWSVGRLAWVLGLVSVLLTGTTGCSLIGEFVQQQQTTQGENLRHQKLTARETRIKWPNIEIITFIDGGNISGSGQWAANAIITIGGEEYRKTIGPGFGIGDVLPLPSPGSSPGRVTVNYSDGTSELLQ